MKKLLLLFAVIMTAISSSAENYILYKTYNGNTVTPQHGFDSSKFGANIISNTYKDGTGMILFDGEVSMIGDEAFNACGSLTSIEIPSSVTSIGILPFNNCSNLETFTGRYASEDHRCLIVNGVLKAVAGFQLYTYVIPSSVKKIEIETFANFTNLSYVKIPNSVKEIGDFAFRACRGLYTIEIPNSVESIGKYAFADCSKLNEVYLSSSLTYISERMFQDCTGLYSIVIPNSVKTIAQYAF